MHFWQGVAEMDVHGARSLTRLSQPPTMGHSIPMRQGHDRRPVWSV